MWVMYLGLNAITCGIGITQHISVYNMYLLNWDAHVLIASKARWIWCPVLKLRLIGGVLGDSAPNTSQWILPSAVIFSIDDLEILASDDLDCSVDMRSMSKGNVRRRRSIGLLCKGHTIIVERYTHQSFLPIRRWRCEYLPLQGLEQVQFWFSPSAACLLYAPWVGQALSSTTWSTWSKHDHWNDHWFHHETILRQCT